MVNPPQPLVRWQKVPADEVLVADWINSDAQPLGKSYGDGQALRWITAGQRHHVELQVAHPGVFAVGVLIVLGVILVAIWKLAEPEWRMTLSLLAIGFEACLFAVLVLMSNFKQRHRVQLVVDLQSGMIELPRLGVSIPIQSIERLQWIEGQVGFGKLGTAVELYALVRHDQDGLQRFFVLESPSRSLVRKLAELCNLPVEERVLGSGQHVDFDRRTRR